MYENDRKRVCNANNWECKSKLSLPEAVWHDMFYHRKDTQEINGNHAQSVGIRWTHLYSIHASMSLTREVSQDRLEFWQDALNIAVNKRKETRSYGFPFFGATPMVISVSSILERIEDHFDR